jgi:hypothetical protein
VLAHFIEEQGVPTTSISLIRPHTEIIKPPRALWVPFELGRPMGPPNNAAFQKRVLMALLELLEAPSGPLLVDFPDDEPVSSDEPTVLACPVIYTQAADENRITDQLEAAFRREMTALRPWYDMSLARRKRTTVGISGIGLEELGDFIYAVAKGRDPENPRKDLPMPLTIKFAAEDLKAYYNEAVTSQPGQEKASSQTLQDWFWDETKAGEVLLELKKVCEASQDKVLNMIGAHFIVPGAVARRKGFRPHAVPEA